MATADALKITHICEWHLKWVESNSNFFERNSTQNRAFLLNRKLSAKQLITNSVYSTSEFFPKRETDGSILSFLLLLLCCVYSFFYCTVAQHYKLCNALSETISLEDKLLTDCNEFIVVVIMFFIVFGWFVCLFI